MAGVRLITRERSSGPALSRYAAAGFARGCQEQLAIFDRYSQRGAIGSSRVERTDEHAFALRPEDRPDRDGERDLQVVFMALTHGDESSGLAVINALCDFIERGILTLSCAVGFILANVDAAVKGKRFIDRDLNRSFGRDATEAAEDRRAKEIENILRRTRHLVDLHQTIEPSDSPFFVFAYTERNLRLATAISRELPIVTHWGRPFSAGALPRANPIYTWCDIVAYPPGRVVLDEGFRNLQPIRQGQRLGKRDGSPLIAARRGLMLFPKYVRSEAEPRPAEPYRLLRRVAPGELGQGDCLAPAEDDAEPSREDLTSPPEGRRR